MLNKWLSIFLVALAHPAVAQGLSSAECTEIRQTYGITPAQCDTDRAVALVLGTRTEPSAQERQNHVFFPAGGSRLDAAAQQQLQQIAAVLETPVMQNACIKLIGHSDTSGPSDQNLKIGIARANAIHAALEPMLSNPARIEIVISEGEAAPLSALDPQSNWQRRVAIWARSCA